jgi:hypothetical protein
MTEIKDVLRHIGWSDQLIDAYLNPSLDESVRDTLVARELVPQVLDTSDVVVAGPKTSDGTHLVLTTPVG